jgi:hypothetical protein
LPELGPWCDTFAIQALGLKYGVGYLPETGAVFVRRQDTFSGRVLANPLRTLDMIVRARDAMRSARFREIFPSDYVDAFTTTYVDGAVKFATWSLRPDPEARGSIVSEALLRARAWLLDKRLRRYAKRVLAVGAPARTAP